MTVVRSQTPFTLPSKRSRQSWLRFSLNGAWPSRSRETRSTMSLRQKPRGISTVEGMKGVDESIENLLEVAGGGDY